MKTFPVALLAATTLLCSSCSWFSAQPPAPQVTVPSVEVMPPSLPAPPNLAEIRKAEAEIFRKDDITLVIRADQQLNRFQNNAHALFLCIYQLKDPNGFNQLTEEEGGMAKMLECRRFDATVANAKRQVVQPGQELREIRDRAQGARFIGIAAGYYGTGKERVTHLAPLTPAVGAGYGGTTITIELGPYEIESVTVK